MPRVIELKPECNRIAPPIDVPPRNERFSAAARRLYCYGLDCEALVKRIGIKVSSYLLILLGGLTILFTPTFALSDFYRRLTWKWDLPKILTKQPGTWDKFGASPDYRWPLAAGMALGVAILFCATYLFVISRRR
jgi:hypothetical protein